MKTLYILFFLNLYCSCFIQAQSVIQSGDVSGNWTKRASPYIIMGDINIPVGKSLKIDPGVKVIFKGQFLLNVQGNLYAEGLENDTIIFTISDTSGFFQYFSGWNGIHFDPRAIIWEKQFREDTYINLSSAKVTETPLRPPDELRSFIKLAEEDVIDDSVNYYIKTKSISRISFCKFTYCSSCRRERPYIFGGAIYIYQYPNLSVKNSVFLHCKAYSGGALYCKEAAPVILNNFFQDCHAISSGGAMAFIHSGPIIGNNRILHNSSGFNGGGLLLYESCPFVLNNSFFWNSADKAGGAIHMEKAATRAILFDDYNQSENTKSTSQTTTIQQFLETTGKRALENSNGKFYNNIICKNQSLYGGGISSYATSPEFVNLTLCDNSALNGSGLYYFYSAPLMINSIIYNNQSDKNDHQILVSWKNRMEIRNSILQSGSSSILKDSTCKLELIYSDLIDSPPLFMDRESLNYSLKENSPCIDAGFKDTISVVLTKSDINGNKRINNSIVDIGAIEYSTDENSLTQKSAEDRQYLEQEELFNLYPNPNQGRFSLVVYNNRYEKIQVQVFSYNGIKVYDQLFSAQEFSELLVNLENNPSGVYVLKAISNGREIYKNTLLIE